MSDGPYHDDPYTDETKNLAEDERARGDAAAARLAEIRARNATRRPVAPPASYAPRPTSTGASSSGMRRGGVLILLIGIMLISGSISMFLFLNFGHGQMQVLANQQFALSPGQEIEVHSIVGLGRPVKVRFDTDGSVSTNASCDMEKSGVDAILMCQNRSARVAIMMFPGYYNREQATEPLQGRMYGFQGTIYLE